MDMEARAHSEHPEALRLWLRLLTCTQIVEKQVRTQLRERFDTTLPRFDLMAQLERAPDVQDSVTRHGGIGVAGDDHARDGGTEHGADQHLAAGEQALGGRFGGDFRRWG